MKKRVLSMLMTLALCLTLFPAPAWATEDAPEGGAIVQQEQQEEISPAVSEQAGTNEDENGAEGDPQNTGTPDAGGAEDSKADAPEIGEDENAGNNADAAVSAVQTMIDALPTVSELDGMTADELDAAYDDIQAAYDAYEALNAEQQAQITGADFEALLGWFNSQTAPLEDAQSGVHTHCVCGSNHQEIGDHKSADEKTFTAWTATDALPSTAGSYYLTQSVTADWTVPTGEVTLCLNGQTISGSITVGSGATLTLTDCSNSGRVQGGVLVNGGKFELYSGTITGGVQVGIKGGTYQTGSSFTMYGGAITGNEASSGSGGGVFLVGTTNHIDPPSFTMHGGTISNNTAGASDGGGGGVYVGEKCSFTMDGGTITGNTATKGNGGGIYIHFNAGNVSISNATITGNKATATGNTSYGHGGGIYSQRGVTVKNVTITGNNSTYEGGGIYGKGAITLTDATVTDNNHYDIYYDGKESTTPKLTVSGSVQAGYYANYDWKLPILVSGELSENSVIHVGVREGIKPGYGNSLAIAEPANGVTLRAENFKADTAESETSLGNDGKVYLSPCEHEMDDTGYTCKKCHTQFDARIGESAYYKTLKDAFLNAWDNSTITLMRDVNLNNNCFASDVITLDLHGKTITSENKFFNVNKELTVKDSGTGGGTQALDVTFYVSSNGTLAVGDSYTGKISRVELQAGGALERFGGEIGELVLSNAAAGSTSTGYNLKLWKDNTNACTIGKFTDNTTSKSLTVNDLLGTDYAKCELYGEKDGAWSIVPKTEKISELTGYTAYKVQFPECVHQCVDDSNPVCSVCHKELYTKITAKAADGTAKTAYFTEDSALENGYVEAIQTLNGWSNEGCTEPTLTLLRDMYAFGTSMPLTGTLTLKGGTHTAKNVTVAENADVTFASGSYQGATIDGTATVEEGVTFTDASVTVNGTLNAKGGTFNGPVKFNGSSIANISGGSFTSDRTHGGVEFGYNVTGTISGGTFAFADFYTTKVKLSGGTFTTIKTNGDRKLADLLAEGAAYYNDDSAVSNDKVSSLTNVTVKSHEHNGGTDGNGTCSICGKQMAASLTIGGKTSWYTAFASAIEAANAADGEKTITLYQNVDDTVYGKRTAYELTRGPVTLATGGKRVDGVDLIAKGISLTVTGSNGSFYVTVDGKDAKLTVNDKDTELAIVTAKNGGKLSLSNGTFSRVAVKDDGSSASLSGGSYGAITSDAGYVKPYALLAKGYAYKKTTDNQWLPNANSIPSKVTVEKAPFAVEKIYPNSDTNYTGNSAFATDGNITLTAVIAPAPETEGVTYYYWWELFDESENDWTTSFKKVNTATHTGGQSKTLTISGLPVDKSYQYHIFVQCSNGYNCYSEPFTVTQHQHSWTYTASGATITAKCTAEGCYLTDGNGGSVTINAPAELTYSGEGKPATVTASSDWQGPAASGITISYIKSGKYIQQLENGALPTNAGTYTASITVGEATASVKYTIGKATPKAEDFTFTAPTSLTYDGNVKNATVSPADDVIVKYYDKDGKEATPKNAGEYTVKIDVAESTNYAAANGLTADGWKFSITKATVPKNNPIGTLNIINGTCQTYTYDFNNILPGLSGGNYGTISYGKADISLVSPSEYNYDASTAVSDRGVLTLAQFSAKDGKTTDRIGDVKVTVTTTNYENFQLKLVLYAVDQIKPTPDGTITAAEITYGDTLSKSTISGKMKDPDTGDAVNGTFAWTDGTIKPDANDSYKAKWTFTPAAGYEKYATATGTVTIKVKPAKLIVSVKASSMYYTGEEQIASIIASGQSVDSTPVTFTYSNKVDGNYTSRGPTFTDAGTYTVYYKAEAANHEPATGTFTVTIDPLPISLLSVSSISKTYDGSADVTLTANKLTFFSRAAKTSNIKLPDTALSFSDAQFTKQQADGSYLPSPEVGGGKALSFTMTLTSQNYVFEGESEGTTEVSDVFATDDANWFTITKAAAPTMQPIELTVINGLAKTYLVNLPALPTLGDNCKYGSIKYEACNFNLIGEGGYANSMAMITSNDEFQLTVPAVESQTEGSVGTVGVKITTDNYQDMLLTVEVIAKNKIVPVLDGEITATPITFGQILRVSTITGTMKDDGKPVEGTFEWTNPSTKPDKAGDYQAEWTFTPAEGYEKYATVTGTVTIKVNKATPAFTAPTAQENLTYTGQEQALIIAGMTDHGTMQYSLTENGTYSQNIPTGTDAGTYIVWYRVIGDTNHKDTAPASVTVRIGQKPLPITGVTAASKPYDGTTNADITDVTFGNVTLKRDTDYTVTANFDDAGVGNGKNVTATVALIGQTAKNYALEQSSFPTTGSITKAAAPDFTKETALTIVNGHEKTYTVTLPTLPTLETPKEYGAPTYELGEIKLDDGYYTSGAKVENGELTLPIQKNDVGTIGPVGTVTVVIKSTNYEDITLTVNVNAANKIEPTPDGKITASEITYGDTLSKSKISGKMKDPDTGIEVKGTFAWPYPDDKLGQTGDYNVSWIFTPDESYGGIYAAVTDTVKVHVAPKSIEGATITLKKREFAYNAAAQSPRITGVTLEGWDKTITYRIVSGDKATNANDSITLTIKGTGNYTGTATAEWKIIPAKLTVSVPSVTKAYDGTTNATVTPMFDGLQGGETLTAADYSVTAAFDNAKVGYKKTVIGTVTLKQTDKAKNYLLKNDGTFSTGEGTIKKAAAPIVQPVELTIYNGVQKDYYVDLPPLPKLGEGKSYGTVEYRKTPTINLSEGYIAQSELGADSENLNTLRLLLRMKQTGSLTGEIGTVTIPVTTSNYQDINLTVNVSAVNQIKPKPVGTITATPITYGNELSASTITGTMQDPNTGYAVNGTFTWVTPAEKLKAGSHNAKWIFTPDESNGGKYTTNTGTATVTVNPKAVTVSGITAKDKAYDGTTDATLDCSNAKFAGILENDKLTVAAKGMFGKTDVDKQKVTISDLTLGGDSAANYVLAESGNQTETTATITAKEVTVTITSNGGTYGSVVAAAAELSGAVKGENVPVTLTYTGNNYTSAKVPVNAGSYKVTASIANSNYTLTGKTTANFVITPKAVTVTGITANDKVYDGTTDAKLNFRNAKFAGILENDKLTVAAKGMFEKADIGNQKVTISDLTLGGDSAANYVLAESGNQTETTATITAKQIAVSIKPNGGTYGETITPATATANGVVGEDAPAITLTYTGTANDGTKYTGTTPPTKAGTYTITATITNPNYKLDADTATAEFTVAKRSATVTPDNKSKVYEEKDPELTYKVSGVLDSETLEGITLARAKGENAGKYAITATADAGANPNYAVTFAEGTFTIELKSIQSATVVLGKGLAANGAEQTQTVAKVLLVNKELPADSYTVSGNTATAHGIYTLTVTGKGNYKDYVKWTYVIAPAKAEDAPGEDITIGSGKVKVDVQSEGAVPPIGLLTDKAELLAMLVNSGDITADELVQIANGASVDIVLTVKEANVPDAVKTAMAQAAKDYTIGQYLDISLFKYMTVNGSQQAGVALLTTKDALTISVVVPDALINTNSAVNRTYCIVRNHEGTITVLDAAFDAAGKTLTFKTDRFSIYAIAYKDTAVPSSGSKPSSNNSSNDSETKKNEVAPTPAPTPTPTQTPANTAKPSTITAMPQTGDTSNPTLYVVLLVASLLGLAVVFVCKKRNDK